MLRLHKFRQFLGENKTIHKHFLDLTNSRPLKANYLPIWGEWFEKMG